MTSIETEYRGILYRSRLEARWAIFFDACKLDYVYEPDCFVLEDGKKYTPDFYFPNQDTYVEIKPNLDWLNNPYHRGRYELFEGEIIILSGSFPNVKCSMSYWGGLERKGLFNPKGDSLILFSELPLGGENKNHCDDYLGQVLKVKHHRFYK